MMTAMDGDTRTLPAFRTEDLKILDGQSEPRIRDLVLADRLGMKNPRTIRGELIGRNIKELEAFGPLSSTTTMVPIGSGAKREVSEYWLNEEQALAVCFLSRTAKAVLVRRAVIRVFTAWRRGQLPPGQPVNELESRIRELEGQLQHERRENRLLRFFNRNLGIQLLIRDTFFNRVARLIEAGTEKAYIKQLLDCAWVKLETAWAVMQDCGLIQPNDLLERKSILERAEALARGETVAVPDALVVEPWKRYWGADQGHA